MRSPRQIPGAERNVVQREHSTYVLNSIAPQGAIAKLDGNHQNYQNKDMFSRYTGSAGDTGAFSVTVSG